MAPLRRVMAGAAAFSALILSACASQKDTDMPTPPSPAVPESSPLPALIAGLGDSHWTTLASYRVHYYDWGDPGAGTVISYIHGYAANGYEASPVARLLCGPGSGIRLLAIDLPGAGFSQRPTASLGIQAYTRLVADWHALIETELAPGQRRRILWAHSLGAHMSLRSLHDWRFKPQADAEAPDSDAAKRLARRASMSRIDGLVLSAPNGLKGEEGIWSSLRSGALLRFLAPLYSEFVYSSAARLNVYRDFDRTDPLVHRVGYLALSWNGGLDSLANITDDTLSQDPIDNILGDIELPTLLTWGDADRVLAYRWSAVFNSRLPQVSFHTLKGYGHGAHVEQPRWFADLIKEFSAEPRTVAKTGSNSQQ